MPQFATARYFRTSRAAFAAEPFKLAEIGEGIAEVTVTEWMVKEGDMVKKGDNICSVESDKASVELPSPFTGKVVKIHHKLQDVVKVGSILIDVDTGGATAAASPSKAAPATAAPAAQASSPATPSAAAGVTKPFLLADIGEGIAEVTVTEWFVKEGDMVKELENVCAVESDKASVELSSPYTGKVVKVHHKVQDVVKVGSVLIDVDVGGTPTAAAAAPQLKAPVQAAAPAVTPAAGAVETKPFKLADIGEGIAEVQVTEWFVKEGDVVKEMDNLCSVESDKASVELSSPFSGTVSKIYYKVSDNVKVGATLCDINAKGSAAVAVAPASAPVATAVTAQPAVVAPLPAAGGTSSTTTPSTKAPGVLATPKVRRMAREQGVDLNTLSGSGPSGRVLPEDVTAAATAKVAPVVDAAPTAVPSAPVVQKPEIAVSQRPVVRPGEEKVVQITSAIGKGMVKSMEESLKMPFMALGEEIDVTDILALQASLKEHSMKKYGTRPTLTTFLIKALSLALNEYPIINSRFGASGPLTYTMYGNHNISVAVDTPHGLVVPNIKDVGNLSVIEVQQELLRLAGSAQANKLALGDIKGGTVTLSNIGSIGTKDPRPILFDGQAVIGAVGRTMVLPRYNSKMELVPRKIANVRWVGDHRHLDGATLARFSNSFKRYVENPGEWTLALR
jgi:2-oxoisovalerate dehydrogenase E2 component (dihydrolipoyl transacylase)